MRKFSRLSRLATPCRFAAVALALFFGVATAPADIHDPPGNDFGPTRKLGRGIGNLAFGFTDIFNSVGNINIRQGSTAACSYGFVQGTGRMMFRVGAGVYEVVTFPFPTYKASYRPFYKSDVHWIHGGLSEFPPELGFENNVRYNKVRTGY